MEFSSVAIGFIVAAGNVTAQPSAAGPGRKQSAPTTTGSNTNASGERKKPSSNVNDTSAAGQRKPSSK